MCNSLDKNNKLAFTQFKNILFRGFILLAILGILILDSQEAIGEVAAAAKWRTKGKLDGDSHSECRRVRSFGAICSMKKWFIMGDRVKL